MPKYSIIVPVYNVEKYIDRCLDSIVNQTLDDYEVIIINDGSTDSSKNKISKYLSNEKFKYYEQKNMGISITRNKGIDLANGSYILFLDSDDYLFYRALEIIDESLEGNLDILKFQYKRVYIDKEEEVNDNFEVVDSGKNILLRLINNQCDFETPWMYVYNAKFFKENNFRYEENICHEDFALTPYILSKAKKMKVIKDVLYNYVQVNGSITRNEDYKKIYKNVYDMYIGYELNYKYINNNVDLDDNFKKVFNSYLANIAIKKGLDLNREDRRVYYKMLSKNKVYDNLLTDTFSRKLKKIILKINANLYFKIKGDK